MNDKTNVKRSGSDTFADRVAPVMSEIELAKLGGGQVAYIKVMTSEQARAMFPTVEGLPQGISLYALHAADGTPIMLTDSREAAVANAWSNELQAVSVH